jgi:hypothetical protein
MEEPAPAEGSTGEDRVADDDLVTWAAAESEARLSDLGDRWLHVQGVAAKAAWVSQAFDGEDRAHLLAAAHLHDVGYAPSLRVTGLHQLDGAAHLRALGQERLARLVAHHSEARFELELRGWEAELAKFPRETSPVAEALIYCDLTPARRAHRCASTTGWRRCSAGTVRTVWCPRLSDSPSRTWPRPSRRRRSCSAGVVLSPPRANEPNRLLPRSQRAEGELARARRIGDRDRP